MSDFMFSGAGVVDGEVDDDDDELYPLEMQEDPNQGNTSPVLSGNLEGADAPPADVDGCGTNKDDDYDDGPPALSATAEPQQQQQQQQQHHHHQHQQQQQQQTPPVKHPKEKTVKKTTRVVKKVVVKGGEAIRVSTVTQKSVHTPSRVPPASHHQDPVSSGKVHLTQQLQQSQPHPRVGSSSSGQSTPHSDIAHMKRTSGLSDHQHQPAGDGGGVSATPPPAAASAIATPPVASLAPVVPEQAAPAASDLGPDSAPKQEASLTDRLKKSSSDAVRKLQDLWKRSTMPDSARSNTSSGSEPVRAASAAIPPISDVEKHRRITLGRIRAATSIRHGANSDSQQQQQHLAMQKPPNPQQIRLKRFRQFVSKSTASTTSTEGGGGGSSGVTGNNNNNDSNNSFVAGLGNPNSRSTSAAPSTNPSPVRSKIVVKRPNAAAAAGEADLAAANADPAQGGFIAGGFEEDQPLDDHDGTGSSNEHSAGEAAHDHTQRQSDNESKPNDTGDSTTAADATPPKKLVSVHPAAGAPAAIFGAAQRFDLRLRTLFTASGEKFVARREQRAHHLAGVVAGCRTALSQAAEVAISMAMFYEEPSNVA